MLPTARLPPSKRDEGGNSNFGLNLEFTTHRHPTTVSHADGKPPVPSNMSYAFEYYLTRTTYLPLKTYRPHKIKVPLLRWLQSMYASEGNQLLVSMKVFLYNGGNLEHLKHVVLDNRVWGAMSEEAKINVKTDFSVVMWKDDDLQTFRRQTAFDMFVTKSVSELLYNARNRGKRAKDQFPLLLFSRDGSILFGVVLGHRTSKQPLKNHPAPLCGTAIVQA